MMQLSQSQKVAKAEALWAMKAAVSNYSFASSQDIVPLFQAMFEGNSIVDQMQLCDRKVSYVLSHGLGLYFQNDVIAELKKSSSLFTLAFDETTSQIKKQLDIYIRFWSKESVKVVSSYINSVFLGHADADKICCNLVETLNNHKLPLSKLLMLSMDGPNVNKAVAKKLNERLELENSPELVDFGTCSLHKVHNSFSKAVSSFSLDLDQFANYLFGFFKLSAARREDLKELQSLLIIEEKFLLRHMNSRWLTLCPILNRIILMHPALKEYFINFLPKQKSFPTVQKNLRYLRIVKELKDPASLTVLEFVSDVIPILDSYLAIFQAEEPLVHLLYNKTNELLRNIMIKFVKENLVGTKGVHLYNINIDETVNLKPIQEINVGVATKRTISKLKELDSKCLRFEIKNFLLH